MSRINTMGLFCLLGLFLFNLQAVAKSTHVKTAQINALWKASIPLNNPDIAEQYPYEHCFKQASQIHDIPVEILLALARGESNFNARAKSKSNAYGVMQILWPSTSRHLGVNSLEKLLQPCTNIEAGTRYLKELLQRYNGNIHLAMAAYNYGPGRIKSSMTRSGMPNGAIWYSQYIYDHYQSIVQRQTKRNMPETQKPKKWQYQPNNQVILLSFSQPYRAKGFTNYLKEKNPDLKIEWFKTPQALYKVVLRYDNQDDFKRSKINLKQQGFSL